MMSGMTEDRRVVARLADGITVVSVVDECHGHRYGVYCSEVLLDEFLTLRELLRSELLTARAVDSAAT